MKFCATLIVLLLQASDAPQRPDTTCPSLPADSEMTWDYHQAGDVGVCYAVEASTGEKAFGVYLGDKPRLVPSSDRSVGQGVVAGRSITWYELSEGYFFPEPPSFSRETLIVIDQSGRYAHIWVTATSSDAFARRLSVLERIEIR